MKYLIIILLFGLYSCSEIVDKPKNLIDEDTMAELVAEFAINDQLGNINPNGNMEISSKYILDKYKVKGSDFSDSHTYYLSKPNKMNKIYDKAKKIILEKEPSLKDKIHKENSTPEKELAP